MKYIERTTTDCILCHVGKMYILKMQGNTTGKKEKWLLNNKKGEVAFLSNSGKYKAENAVQTHWCS